MNSKHDANMSFRRPFIVHVQEVERPWLPENRAAEEGESMDLVCTSRTKRGWCLWGTRRCNDKQVNVAARRRIARYADERSCRR